jgi:hypothetical protein
MTTAKTAAAAAETTTTKTMDSLHENLPLLPSA